MNVDENFENNVKIIWEKKKFLCDLLLKSSQILTALYPIPMNMVPNLSLGSGLSSSVSHMQII